MSTDRDPKILIIDGLGPTGGEWRDGRWASDAGYVQVTTHPMGPASTVETHQIREATADDATCCRCDEPIAAGSQIHTVTVTAPDGTVAHRQATHLHHLR